MRSNGEEGYKTRYERAMDEASISGDVLGEGGLSEHYGRGVRIDLRSFFKESRRAEMVLATLDPVERFVLLSYFLLRKTDKQLAELVGLNECRFSQFLENLIHKVGAILAFENVDPELWEDVLAGEGQGFIMARKVLPKKLTQALRESKTLRTSDVLIMFLRKRSFLEVGREFEVYYVDLRRSLEEVSEILRSRKKLAPYSLGEFIWGQIQFADVKEEGYAGKMRRLPNLIHVQDAAIFGSGTIRMESKEITEVFAPRALGAIQGSGL